MWGRLAFANNNEPIYYNEGDYVLDEGVLYLCIESGSHTDKIPPDYPNTWEEQPILPDDVRITADSPYQGYGLLDTP